MERRVTHEQIAAAYTKGDFGVISNPVACAAIWSCARARIAFQDPSANIAIDATTGSASAGNPLLDPIYADQFELGAEWYFADASPISVTYF